jgi:hypothetical protein
MGDQEKDVIIVTPLSITDIVKAIREILGLVQDATRMVTAAGGAIQKYKGQDIAGAIDDLAFKSDGSRKHLERIAEGKANIRDFEGIATLMNQTGGRVEAAIHYLQSNRKFIRQRHGMAIANQIDEIIYAGGGKTSIRLDLEMLARMENNFYSPDDVATKARRILANINTLNEKLEKAHDILIELEKRA